LRTLDGEASSVVRDELRYWGLVLSAKLTPVVSVVDEEMAVDRDGFYSVSSSRWVLISAAFPIHEE